ncbi:MAG TPA: hypothetical protein VFV07_02325 [Rhizomicrobium sp.]|nr:hypothetical protein [Rhizomicrobium sp.]
MGSSSAYILPRGTGRAVHLLAALGIVLALAACSRPSPECWRYQSAKHFLALAKDAYWKKHDFADADRQLDRGLAVLGHLRPEWGVIDDTGQALLAVIDMKRSGELQGAYDTKRGVLMTRMSQFARENSCPADQAGPP